MNGTIVPNVSNSHRIGAGPFHDARAPTALTDYAKVDTRLLMSQQLRMATRSTNARSTARPEAEVSVVDRELPALAHDYTAWLITSLAVRLSRGASSYYAREWKIGSTEYRLLMALGREDACSAISAATAADIDKAAASRSLQILQGEGLIEMIRRGREMQIRLTGTGRGLRIKLKAATDRRDGRLTHGLSANEVVRLRADLRLLIDNLPFMNED